MDALVVTIDPALGVNTEYIMSIYDLQGSLVKRQKMETGEHRIGMGSEKGVFYIKVEHKGEIIHSDKIIRL